MSAFMKEYEIFQKLRQSGRINEENEVDAVQEDEEEGKKVKGVPE